MARAASGSATTTRCVDCFSSIFWLCSSSSSRGRGGSDDSSQPAAGRSPHPLSLLPLRRSAPPTSGSFGDAVGELVQEVLNGEISRIQENLAQDLRRFEVQFSMQVQMSVAAMTPSRVTRREFGCSEGERVRMRILQLEQQRRRRKQQVGALRRALHQVRNLFTDDKTSSSEHGDLAASQLLAEIRAERERWIVEKRMLEEQISRYEALDSENTAHVPTVDPEKESLKKALKQLQMTIESKDHYACWVCNQQAARATWGDDDDDDDDAVTMKRQTSSGSMQDEVATMRERIEEMQKELKQYRELTFSECVNEEPISPVGTRSSRGRVATPYLGDVALDDEATTAGDSSPAELRVRIDEEAAETQEIAAGPVSQMRNSRNRIATPFIHHPSRSSSLESSSGRSVQFADEVIDTGASNNAGTSSVEHSQVDSTGLVQLLEDDAVVRTESGSSIVESRAMETSSTDEVSSAAFAEYSQSMANILSKGHDAIRNAIVSFMEDQKETLWQDRTVKANFAPFLIRRGDKIERIGIKIAVQKDGDAFHVSYRSLCSFLTGALGGKDQARSVSFSDVVSTEEVPCASGTRTSRGRILTPFFEQDAVKEHTLTLRFGTVNFHTMDHEAFKAELLSQSPTESYLRVWLQEDYHVFAHLCGDAKTIAQLGRHFTSKPIVVMGCVGVILKDEREVHFADGDPLEVNAASTIGTGQALKQVRSRTPTAYVNASDDRGTANVHFNDDPSVSEVQVSSVGTLKSSRSRKPTNFVQDQSLPSEESTVHFDDRPFVGTAASNATDGSAKSVRGRVPTAYVSNQSPNAASADNVNFDDVADVSEVAAASAGHLKSIRGRVPTKYEKKDAAAMENTVQFDRRTSVGTAASAAVEGEAKSLRTRIPTRHVPNEEPPYGVKFIDNADVSLVPAAADGDLKSLRGRLPTRFAEDVPPDVHSVHFDPLTFSKAPSGCAADVAGSRLTSKASGDDSAAVCELSMNPSECSGFRSRGSTCSRSSRSESSVADDDDVATDGEASAPSSRSSRSRISTPFMSGYNLGFDMPPQDNNTSDIGLDVCGREEGGSCYGSESTARSSSQGAANRRRSDPQPGTGSPSEAGTVKRNVRSTESKERRKLVKQVSIESHCEREITKAVKRSIQHRARQDRYQRQNGAPVLPQGWARVRKAFEGGPGKIAAHEISPEQDIERRRVPGAEKDIELLKESLCALEIFDGLEEELLISLIDTMEVYEYNAGENAVRQGDQEGSHLFVVASGEFDVVIDGRERATFGVGQCFGESALLLFGERSATVRANCKSQAYAIEGMVVRDMLRIQYEQKHAPTTLAVDEVLASGSIDMLENLNDFQLQHLYDKAQLRAYKKDEVLLTEGERNVDVLFIVLSGTVSLHSRQVELQRLGPYGLVGDRGMVFDQTLTTVVAEEDVRTLALTRELLSAIFGNQLQRILVQNRVLSYLAKHEVFSRLHEEQQIEVAQRCEVLTLGQGDELEGHDIRFVAVLYGEVVTSPHAASPDEGSPVSPSDASPSARHCFRRYSGAKNECFGEQYLLDRHKQWDINVRASGLSVAKLAVWRSKDIDRIVGFDHLEWSLEQDKKVRILRNVFVFRTLSKQQLWQLASSLEVEHVAGEEKIIREGDIGTNFYIIRKGRVRIEKDGKLLRTQGIGDYFGERALIHNAARSATIIADEDSEVWTIGKESFESIMNSAILDYINKRIALQETKVTFADLQFVRVIGRGGFGVVKMVRSRTSKARYALKCVRKKDVVDKGQQESLVSERSILAEVDHPFIIKYVRSFNTDRYVYFLTELVCGGELLDALDTLGLLTHAQAQFYTASISLAMHYLHERRIAYLDLKSENCLIDHQGYLKIIDFGIAQRIPSGRCFVMKGTPMFMAPEMILMKGYNTAADLWSLGVCLYEFVIGEFPFGNNCTSTVAIFEDVVKAQLKFPSWFEKQPHSKDTASLIRGLLVRNPAERTGVGADGFARFQEHPFFKSFNWDDLMARKLTPPHVPKTETYAEDKEGGPQSRLATEDIPPLEDEETRANEEAADDWVDPNPGWDKDF